VRDIGLEDMSASARALLDAREGEEGGRVGRRRGAIPRRARAKRFPFDSSFRLFFHV
jgi:hypothetical protein